MSFLSSTVSMAPSSASLSSNAKIKRKSRRRRTISEDPEHSQLAFEASGERTPHRQRVLTESDISAQQVKASSTYRSRRTPTPSLHRHGTLSTGTPSLLSAIPTHPVEPSVQVCLTARRSLTSSASSIRPSHRKRLEEAHPGDTSHRLAGRQHSSSNNNEPESDNEPLRADPERLSTEDWLIGSTSTTNNCAVRMTLPSRASKYRNLSAGVNKKPRVQAAVPTATELPDRPPSRQRHAFPTHLIDANAFDAPETTSRRGRSSSSSSASSTQSCSHKVSRTDPSCQPEGITTDRPPSRYMVKAKRSSNQSLPQDPSALSRRGVVDKNLVFSCNQAHHDPKTDGFADVDESVPPPFRIEVTTNASASPADPRAAPSLSTNPRQTRRWPFSNQEQLLRMAVKVSDGSRGSDQALSADLDAASSQLQWFGKDDQINNAHLFETIISLPSPRPTLELDVDVAIGYDLEDSDGPQYRSRNVVTKQHEPEVQSENQNQFPSRRAAAASKMAGTRSVTDQSELQWIRSSTNPFFVNASSPVDYDAMDPETAIEQTPLYSSEDLMTLVATEMTDLHLDDYTAFGDASTPAPPPLMGWSGSSVRPPASRSPPLGTSLGKDFLSLFAQH